MANIVVFKPESAPELFDEHKLFASIRAACLSVRAPIGEAELTAKKICEHMLSWLDTKAEVTSLDLRLRAAKHLTTYNPDAAYLYAQNVVQ